jgi:hypothetical protein
MQPSGWLRWAGIISCDNGHSIEQNAHAKRAAENLAPRTSVLHHLATSLPKSPKNPASPPNFRAESQQAGSLDVPKPQPANPRCVGAGEKGGRLARALGSPRIPIRISIRIYRIWHNASLEPCAKCAITLCHNCGRLCHNLRPVVPKHQPGVPCLLALRSLDACAKLPVKAQEGACRGGGKGGGLTRAYARV